MTKNGQIIINTINVRKIERRKKHMFGNSREARERHICPICDSMDITKRVKTRDYKCVNCKWVGKNIKKTIV